MSKDRKNNEMLCCRHSSTWEFQGFFLIIIFYWVHPYRPFNKFTGCKDLAAELNTSNNPRITTPTQPKSLTYAQDQKSYHLLNPHYWLLPFALIYILLLLISILIFLCKYCFDPHINWWVEFPKWLSTKH